MKPNERLWGAIGGVSVKVTGCLRMMIGWVVGGDAHKKTIKAGMNQSPAQSTIFKKAAKTGNPITAPRAYDLIWSVTQRPQEDLLNPCFSSIWKVL